MGKIGRMRTHTPRHPTAIGLARAAAALRRWPGHGPRPRTGGPGSRCQWAGPSTDHLNGKVENARGCRPASQHDEPAVAKALGRFLSDGHSL